VGTPLRTVVSSLVGRIGNPLYTLHTTAVCFHCLADSLSVITHILLSPSLHLASHTLPPPIAFPLLPLSPL
jgi:hypothetical protein